MTAIFTNMTNLELVKAAEYEIDSGTSHNPALVSELAARLRLLAWECEDVKERLSYHEDLSREVPEQVE